VDATGAADGSITLGAAGVLPVGFQANGLAPSPDGVHVYASTLDPLTSSSGATVFGVAEIDVSGGPTATVWPVRGLSALAPTRLVAAFTVNEWARQSDGQVVSDLNTYDPTAHLRVYASLDPSGCGPDTAIDCGVAILDPASTLDRLGGNLLPDPAQELPYVAPIPLGNPFVAAALPVAFAPAGPPAAGDQRGVSTDKLVPTILQAPLTGQQQTSAILASPSTDGLGHWFDLGHFAALSDTSTLRTGTRTSVVASSMRQQTGTIDPELPSTFTPAILGVWGPTALGATTQEVWFTPATMAPLIQVTPGYTPTDSFTVTWQGTLPGLARRRAIFTPASGTTPLTVALQEGPAAGPFSALVRVYDATLGIKANDIVEVWLDDPSVCTGTTIHNPGITGDQRPTFEARVIDFLPPDPARWPGGALTLGPLQGRIDTTDITKRLDPQCIIGAGATAFVTVRASEFVVAGVRLGYVGRLGPPTSDVPGTPYVLQWSDESQFAACTVVPWNTAWETGATPAPACDATCRTTCDGLLKARRSRRLFYLVDQCPNPGLVGNGVADECTTNYPQLLDATKKSWARHLPTGPALTFTLGESVAPASGVPFGLVRGTVLAFGTQSGLVPASRRPYAGGTTVAAEAPMGVVGFDRSNTTVCPACAGRENDGARFFVPYPDEVSDMSFGTTATDVRSIR
jgi:hypothetical protein